MSKQVLSTGLLDYIAVTDHNRIDFATQLKSELGEQIIVGEEIMTNAGEVIGLFLSYEIEPNNDLLETIQAIKDQGGLVYVPHPFETYRKGLHPKALDEIRQRVDIIEVCNGRALLQDRGKQAVVWSHLNKVVGCASSDAHGHKGLGKTYTRVTDEVTPDNLVELLKSSTLHTDRPSVHALLYPKYNRLRKKLRSKK